MDAEKLMTIENFPEEDDEKLMTIEAWLEEELRSSEIQIIMTRLLFKIFNKDEEQAIKFLENEKKKLDFED